MAAAVGLIIAAAGCSSNHPTDHERHQQSHTLAYYVGKPLTDAKRDAPATSASITDLSAQAGVNPSYTQSAVNNERFVVVAICATSKKLKNAEKLIAGVMPQDAYAASETIQQKAEAGEFVPLLYCSKANKHTS
ncbi:hypothetical protein [Curtobacterium sp. MCBA15_013]|uniref:hypothetical protein n=2 Tax=unclassified Curtobacterium TaxID=257496 RepID=UPI0011143020|nr:hypothetical protein [Curtobacterium sp. MCBA15_013]